MNSEETVREVCANIREFCDGSLQPYDTVMQHCANRIEQICERELAAKDAEIARLKEALKPVMEFDENQHNKMLNALRSVREAQRIMKEGGEK